MSGLAHWGLWVLMVLVHFGLARGFFARPFLTSDGLDTMACAWSWISPPKQVILQELACLGHAGAMKDEDVLESPSGTTARRGDRQVRDKEMGAAEKTGPMEGATLGPASLS